MCCVEAVDGAARQVLHLAALGSVLSLLSSVIKKGCRILLNYNNVYVVA